MDVTELVRGMIYARQLGEDLLGFALREINAVPFTGCGPVYWIPEDCTNEEAEEIKAETRRQYLRDSWDIIERFGYIIPKEEGFRQALVDVLAEKGKTVVTPIEEWRSIEFVPNTGYAGNVWEIVSMGVCYWSK